MNNSINLYRFNHTIIATAGKTLENEKCLAIVWSYLLLVLEHFGMW